MWCCGVVPSTSQRFDKFIKWHRGGELLHVSECLLTYYNQIYDYKVEYIATYVSLLYGV